MLTPLERDMRRWVNANGGQETILKNDRLCARMMLKYEGALVTAQSDPGYTEGRHEISLDANNTVKALATLRKEYYDDIQIVIQENLESSSKRFEMALDDLNKDLGSKIQHQGDRIIKYLRGGPHQRIKDKVRDLHLIELSSTVNFC